MQYEEPALVTKEYIPMTKKITYLLSKDVIENVGIQINNRSNFIGCFTLILPKTVQDMAATASIATQHQRLTWNNQWQSHHALQDVIGWELSTHTIVLWRHDRIAAIYTMFSYRSFNSFSQVCRRNDNETQVNVIKKVCQLKDCI